jgi:hypothetical protein
LLFLNSPWDVCDNLLEVAGHRVIELFLVLNFKIEENSMIDLAFIPSPLVVKEVLLWQRLEERVVVTNYDTTYYTTKNAESK